MTSSQQFDSKTRPKEQATPDAFRSHDAFYYLYKHEAKLNWVGYWTIKTSQKGGNKQILRSLRFMTVATHGQSFYKQYLTVIPTFGRT